MYNLTTEQIEKIAVEYSGICLNAIYKDEQAKKYLHIFLLNRHYAQLKDIIDLLN